MLSAQAELEVDTASVSAHDQEESAGEFGQRMGAVAESRVPRNTPQGVSPTSRIVIRVLANVFTCYSVWNQIKL